MRSHLWELKVSSIFKGKKHLSQDHTSDDSASLLLQRKGLGQEREEWRIRTEAELGGCSIIQTHSQLCVCKGRVWPSKPGALSGKDRELPDLESPVTQFSVSGRNSLKAARPSSGAAKSLLQEPSQSHETFVN